jgi:benzoylformate decarboxylase/acetolactate synthase-1/2/3 large subunit
MVDAMRAFKFPYLSLNPGSSFRGLHDSLVNYADDEMQMIECPHEKIAVALAHGYAKTTGRPMGVILHNVVGLLHGAMGIYYAYIDRAPVVIFGGSGPAAYDRRRPNIDWIHGANVQGNAVRDYTKWDCEPRSLESVPTAIARGYRVATSEPAGPVYIALDAGLQEQPLDEPVPMPNWDRLKVPTPIGPDPAALRQLATALTNAKRPVIIPGHVGRDPKVFSLLVQLAEEVGIGVIDTNIRHNFPNRHPLCATGTTALAEADCVLFLDVKDMQKPTHELDSINRQITSKIPDGAVVLDLGFNDIGLSSWSEDYAALVETDLQVTADTSVALPDLVAICNDTVAADTDERQSERASWRSRLTELHDEAWRGWTQRVETTREEVPVSTATLASTVWEVVKNYDWVLTAGTASEWAKRTWDFDKHYRTPGRQLGTATQIGISLGVALAHKGTGRLVVDLQPDGDLMFDAGSLWVASYYELPLLVVMFNNRAYYNDWEHQERLARQRGTPLERANIGMEIDNPAPDFATLARSFSWHAEGPITDPAHISAAVQRAAEYVQSTGKPALVDVVCQYK